MSKEERKPRIVVWIPLFDIALDNAVQLMKKLKDKGVGFLVCPDGLQNLWELWRLGQITSFGLDLRLLHDPAVVRATAKGLIELNKNMSNPVSGLTVYAIGGRDMIKAAVEGRPVNVLIEVILPQAHEEFPMPYATFLNLALDIRKIRADVLICSRTLAYRIHQEAKEEIASGSGKLELPLIGVELVHFRSLLSKEWEGRDSVPVALAETLQDLRGVVDIYIIDGREVVEEPVLAIEKFQRAIEKYSV